MWFFFSTIRLLENIAGWVIKCNVSDAYFILQSFETKIFIFIEQNRLS